MMNEIKLYQEMTYVECYDWAIFETPAPFEQVMQLRKTADLYVQIWDTAIAKWNIKTVSKKKLSDVEQIIYSQDRFVREQLQKEIDERIKKWLRVNVSIVQNLLQKYQ